MKKQISFDNGKAMIEEIINFNFSRTFKRKFKLGDLDQIRFFVPDWKKILSSDWFLDPFLERYGIGQIYKLSIACYLEYYRSTHFDFAGQYLQSSIKNIRTFKINSMEYEKLLLELLGQKRKSKLDKKKAEDLKLKIEFPILDVTGHSMHKLFLKAAYNDITEPEQTKLGQYSYTQTFFKKIITYYTQIFTHVEKHTDYTKKEIQELKKYLAEDPIFEELRSTDFSKILSRVKMMLSRYSQKEGQSNDFKQNEEYQNPKVVSADELKNLVKETLESLNEFLVGKKSKEKIEKIQKWISRIKHYYSLSEPFDHTVLVYINDTFSSKQGTIDHINLQIEMLFRRCYREWAKKAFEELNKSEQLTKPEKRIFILMHIGTPYLNYRTPIFDPLLLKYLNYKDLTISTFLYSSVLKIHKMDEIDLKQMNLQLFLSFLKFYAFWVNFIRPKDAEHKKNVEYKKRFVRDQFIEDKAWEGNDLDEYKRKKGEGETKISEFEEIDFADIEIESDETENKLYNSAGEFNQSSSTEDYRAKSGKDKLHYWTISVDGPGMDLKKIINFNLKEFFFRDILEKHCDTGEQELLNKYLIKCDTLDEIGKELNISGTAVHKRVKKILKRLSEEPELRDILTEM